MIGDYEESIGFVSDPALRRLEEEVGHFTIELSRETPASFERVAAACPWLSETDPHDFFALMPYHRDARHVLARERGYRSWKQFCQEEMAASWREGKMTWPQLLQLQPFECRKRVMEEPGVSSGKEAWLWSGSAPPEAPSPLSDSALLDVVLRAQPREDSDFLDRLAAALPTMAYGAEGKPLLTALLKGFEETSLLLIRQGWRGDDQDLAGACVTGCSRAVVALLDQGAEPAASVLSWACRMGQWDCVLLVLSRLEPQELGLLEGLSLPAFLATQGAPSEVFQACLDRGWRDLDGSGWRRCRAMGRDDLVSLMRDVQALPPSRDEDEYFAACAEGDLEEAESWIFRSPRLMELMTRFDKQTLCAWADQGMEDALRIALGHGASPEWTGPLLATPLHFAAWRGSPRLIALLVDTKAPVNVIDNKRHSTPLGWLLRSAQMHGTAQEVRKGATREECVASLASLKAGGAIVLPSYLEAQPDWLPVVE